MDLVGLRAWWAHRQGLDGSLEGADPAEVLALYARAGTSRTEVDTAVAGLAVHELPSALGCTYVVPAEDYGLALTVAQAAVDAGERAVARRLGVDDAEIDRLCAAVGEALADEPLDPGCITELVGDAVRDLGDEGRRRGMATTLGVAFEPADEQQVSLLAGLDGLFLLRRPPADHVERCDADHPLLKSGARDFPEVRAAVAATESWVRDELGDARSNSLDSPESRRPRVEALRAHQA